MTRRFGFFGRSRASVSSPAELAILPAGEKARTASAGKDVSLMGATIVQQFLRSRLLDLELVQAVDAPGVTRLTYRVGYPR